MSKHKHLSYAPACEKTPMSWQELRLPKLRRLGAALASRPI